MPNVSTLTTEDPVLLVQLSDSHLFAEADGSLLGLKTAQSLQQVIDLVQAEQPHIDGLLATGDLTQDGSVEAYQRFRTLTAPLAPFGRWIPGNHDQVAQMREAAVQSRLLEPVVDIGNWRITLLNSAVPHSTPGYLEDDQLQLLAQSLSEAPDRHHLVCLHHHPVSVGCPWLEPIGLRNADQLLRRLGQALRDGPLALGQLVHQVPVGVQAARGVAEHQVGGRAGQAEYALAELGVLVHGKQHLPYAYGQVFPALAEQPRILLGLKALRRLQ